MLPLTGQHSMEPSGRQVQAQQGQQLSQFSVTLLALNGKEKEVVMTVSRQGVQLVAVSDGKEFNMFPFEIIKKWLPANLRSRNPGPDNCLDLQIHTDKGARDLRMRCKDAAAVGVVIEALRSTVSGILRDNQKQPLAAGSAPTTLCFSVEQQQQQQQLPLPKQQQPFPAPPRLTASGPPTTVHTADGNEPAQSRTMMSSTVGRIPQDKPADLQGLQDEAALTSRSAPGNLATSQDLASLPGAIPITVLGTLASPGGSESGRHVAGGSAGGLNPDVFSPGVTQLILAAAPTSSLPASLSSPDRAQAGNNAASRLLNSMGVTDSRDARLPWTTEDQVYQRAGSFGPAYMNAAYKHAAPHSASNALGPGSSLLGAKYLTRSVQSDGGPVFSPSQVMPAEGGLTTTTIHASPTRHHHHAHAPAWPANPQEEHVRQRALDLVMAARMSPRKDNSAVAAAVGRSVQAEAQAASLQAELQEMVAQNSFLESMVKRLTSELALKQSATAGADAIAGTADTELGGDDVPLPVWLKDRRALNPLMLAYDEKIATLEQDSAQRTAAILSLQKQVEAVIAENESLRAELGKALDSRAVMAAMAEGAAITTDTAAALLKEEADLLRQENELLVSQQAGLDAELQRLHAQLQEQATQSVAMTHANASMMARVQQQVYNAQNTEARHSKLQAALTAAESRVSVLTQQLAQSQSQLEDERINADTASRALAQLQQGQASLKSESQTNAQAARAAVDQQAVMQAELSSVRERYESVVGQLSKSRQECDDLRSTLASLDAKLSDYQHRDAQAFTRIREAVELAESCRAARDAAVARQSDLEQEVKALHAHVAGVRKAVHDQVYSELQGTLHALTAELESTKTQLKLTDKQACEYRLAAERAARDCASLTSELHTIKEELGETLSSKSKVTLMTLSTMERIQEVERERDDATQNFDSTRRQLERAQRDWALEKQKFEAELRSVRKALVDREAAATMALSDATGLARQVESLTAELAALREQRARNEADLRQQVAAVRSERDVELKSMANRLDAALSACAASMKDAERMIESKDALLARWKEEATLVASKMERALADHKREVESREAAMDDLRGQVQALHSAHTAAVHELEELRATLPSMQAALHEAESRNAQLHMQLLAANNRDEELTQELRSLQALLERSRFMARTQPQNDQTAGAGHVDELVAKFKALRQQHGDAVVDVQALLDATHGDTHVKVPA